MKSWLVKHPGLGGSPAVFLMPVVPCSFFPSWLVHQHVMEDIQELMSGIKVPLFELSILLGRGMLPERG